MNIPEKQRTMDIDSLFKAFRKCRIAVIGDLMLDKYIFGHVSRISPEYPVPVVDVTKQEFRLGGAANVAVNTRAMGAETILIGVTGADADATSLRKLLEDGGISPEDIVTDESRPTTSKTRILSQNHHITRVDHEKRTPVDEHVEEEIIGKVNKELDSLDAIILEDYNKGVLTPRVAGEIISLARKHNVPVLVDPKLQGFFNYQGCTVFKPNLSEIAASLGTVLTNNSEEIEKACKELKEKMECRDLVVTRSEKGITIFNDRFTHIPATSLEVADVSGAGDTVIALLALGIASGLSITQSAEIANLAAGTVCQEVGAVAVKPEKLRNACQAYFSS